MSFGMLVQLHVKPGHMQQVTAILEGLLPRVASEDGCLAYTLYSNDSGPDTIWLYEVYESKQYHREVHSQYPEVKLVMEQLPEHMAAPWLVLEGDELLTLPQTQPH
ncbi:MAG TPA: putative quinol monooxygenase [Pseudonocardia sp.]